MWETIRNLFFEDALAKLGALLLAIGLWWWVMVVATVDERVQTVPVQVTGLPSDIEVLPGSNPTVSLRFRGSRFSGLTQEEVAVKVELNEVEFPQTRYEIHRSDVQFPQGWDLESIDPRVVTFEFRRVMEQSLPLEPNLSNRPENLIIETSVVPPEARVRGPRQYLVGMDSLPLENVNLQDVTPPGANVEVRALVPTGMELLEPATNRFQLQIDMYEQVDRHEITSVPVDVTGVPEGWQAVVEPATLTVVVQGPREIVQQLESEDIIITVPAPTPEVGRTIELTSYELPEDVELADGFTRQQPVQIRLERAPEPSPQPEPEPAVTGDTAVE